MVQFQWHLAPSRRYDIECRKPGFTLKGRDLFLIVRRRPGSFMCYLGKVLIHVNLKDIEFNGEKQKVSQLKAHLNASPSCLRLAVHIPNFSKDCQ